MNSVHVDPDSSQNLSKFPRADLSSIFVELKVYCVSDFL